MHFNSDQEAMDYAVSKRDEFLRLSETSHRDHYLKLAARWQEPINCGITQLGLRERKSSE